MCVREGLVWSLPLDLFFVAVSGFQNFFSPPYGWLGELLAPSQFIPELGFLMFTLVPFDQSVDAFVFFSFNY